MKKVLFATTLLLIGAVLLLSCRKDNLKTEAYVESEVFLKTFEEKLNLVFQVAEMNLNSRTNQNLESLFKNAYIEALGDYADENAFDNGFWGLNPNNNSVQTRSVEEAELMGLIQKIINLSENIEDAIKRFEKYSNDETFSIDDRIKFISLREFLIFYERNTTSIYALIQSPTVRSGGITWSCVAGTYGSYLGGGLGGCVGGGGLGVIFGGKIGAAVGCAVGGIIGGASGLLAGAATFCADAF
ncbi:MAG: hypothetical protein LBI15_10695 [Dysgonamonadaceae bacterium]|jgi:hypothetical protein|nr:hypothetical protein [Dysgonamonadaceae bacterium]